jgi:hypothetical protein
MEASRLRDRAAIQTEIRRLRQIETKADSAARCTIARLAHDLETKLHREIMSLGTNTLRGKRPAE